MLRKYTTIQWENTILSLIPPVLRKRKQAIWLRTLLKPLTSVYEDTLYKMQHNGQVVYFEKVLNEIFNKQEGRAYRAYENTGIKQSNGLIFIDDATRPEVQYLFTHNEIQNGNPEILTFTNTDNPNNVGEPLKKANSFLFLSSDLDFNSTEYFNFRINIPSDLVITVQQYKQEVATVMQSAISEEDKRKRLEKLDCLLMYSEDQPHPFTTHPNAIKIQTPVFHRLVNFYKLAGKSYETRVYDYTPSNNTIQQPS